MDANSIYLHFFIVLAANDPVCANWRQPQAEDCTNKVHEKPEGKKKRPLKGALLKQLNGYSFSKLSIRS